MEDYVTLNEDYVLKHINDKLFVYNYRKNEFLEVPVYSEKFFLLCKGDKKLRELKELNLLSDEELDELIGEGIIIISDKPQNKDIDYVSYEGNFLKHISLDITSRCNLNCSHCYISDFVSKRDISIDAIKRVLLEAKKMGCLSVEISGGEPFMRKDLLKILKMILKLKIGIVAILTNGVLIDEEVINFLRRNNVNTEFYISIDGLKVSHEKFRGRENIYQKIIDNIRKLKVNGFKITVSTSINKYNLGEFGELFDFVNNMGIRRWRVTSPFYSGNWVRNKQKLGVTMEEEVELYKKLIKRWAKEKPSLVLECGNIFRSSEFGKNNQKYKYDSYCCDYYRNFCSIKCNGDVISCGIYHPHFICGNVQKESLNKIWESKKMREFKNLKIKDLLKHNEKCKTCKLLWFCGLGCRFKALTLSGDMMSLDPYMCKITKRYQKE